MSKPRTSKIYAADFETTVYSGQTETEVWASGLVEVMNENAVPLLFSSIDDTWACLEEWAKHDNITLYYHNLKFDGSFWLYFFQTKTDLKFAVYNPLDDVSEWKMKQTKDLLDNQYKYVISDLGQWFQIIVKIHGHIIEFRDSLKLMPFSLKELGEAFQTKHRKLEIEYTGKRYAGWKITDEERRYLENDLYVLKEALEEMFKEGHNQLTIGTCCYKEWKRNEKINRYMSELDFQNFYPNLEKTKINKDLFGSDNAEAYIRRAYRGGWCYVARGKENKKFHNGSVFDVNSLYPSMMHSMSGNYYPVGYPRFWKGNYIPDLATDGRHYYYIRIKCRFHIKEGYLPFIQLKRNPLYRQTEMLETSDVYDPESGKYCRWLQHDDGTLEDTAQVMTLTCTDYELIQKHYDLYDLEILDGAIFYADIGMFDEYIDKYAEMKRTSTGVKRTIAKLFQNNLYGKLAASRTSNYKVAYLNENKALSYYTVQASDKMPGYIPIGAAITSYARRFTITAAQANYYGKDKPGFIYADTDSIHLDLQPEQVKGITVHPVNYCCWKQESTWDTGIFIRQKTYVEIKGDDIDIKCAGMPNRCKDLYITNIHGKEWKCASALEKEFMKHKRTIDDFKVGLRIPGKLVPRNIPGGVVLKDTTFEIR